MQFVLQFHMQDCFCCMLYLLNCPRMEVIRAVKIVICKQIEVGLSFETSWLWKPSWNFRIAVTWDATLCC